MSSMFASCNSLTSITWPAANGWNTSGVSTMQGMFQYCYSLQTIDLSMFNVSVRDQHDLPVRGAATS